MSSQSTTTSPEPAQSTTSPETTPEIGRYMRVTDITTTSKHKGILPVSPSTLWRWVRQGKFPAPVRLTSCTVVWKESAITAWLAAQEQAGAK